MTQLTGGAPATAHPVRLTLRDGSLVELRQLTAASRDRLRAGFGALSPRSRYLRFMSPVHELSERDLRYLAEVDQRDHLAWGAVDPSLPGQPGLGVARCVRLRNEPTVAEPALAVVDSHHRRGLGTALLEVLARSAYDRGITTWRAYVLAENVAMLSLLRRFEPALILDGGGVVRAEIDVARVLGRRPAA